MGFYYANFKNVRPFLARHAAKESAKKSCETFVNEVLPLPSSPRDVVIKAVPHALNMSRVAAAGEIKVTRKGTKSRASAAFAADAEPRL